MVMPLRIKIAYHRRNADDKIIFEMSLWKLPKYTINTRLVDLYNTEASSNIKVKGKTSLGFMTRMLVTTLAVFPKRVGDFVDGHFVNFKIPYDLKLIKEKLVKTYRQYRRYLPAFKYLLSRTKCLKFHWRTSLGLADAAVTGWVTGSLWVVKPLLLGKVFSLVTPVRRPVMMVRPEFSGKHLTIDFDCIFEVRIGYIMVTRIISAFKR